MVLDNCEHLREQVATIVDIVLERCRARVLATSRATLEVHGERVWNQPPLAIDEAEALFAECVARGRNSTAPVNGDAVRQLCERLELMPLAIELAAGRLGPAGVEELDASIVRTIDVGRRRGGAERQQTLGNTIRWSIDLLDDAAHTVLRAASVFPAPWTLRDAEQLAGVCGVARADVADALDDLVDHSLLIAEHGPGGTRYRMLAPIREFGRDQLEGHGEVAVALDATIEWAASVARTNGVGVGGATRPRRASCAGRR